MGRLFRDLHTIKGSAATFGFDTLGRIAHQAEDLLEAMKAPLAVRTSDTLQEILRRLDEMEKACSEIKASARRLMGKSADGDALVPASEKKLDRIRRLGEEILSSPRPAEDVDGIRTLAAACARIRDVPLSRLCEKHRAMAVRLAERLGKELRFEARPPQLEVPPGFLARLDGIIAHLLRNAVDHGLELPSRRVSAGKPEQGCVSLDVRIEEDLVLLSLSDDGAGIDFESIARKAVEAGAATPDEVLHMDDAAKARLVFGSGVSTSDSVTDISGRGVGMSAVRESVESLGGSVELESERGRGTRVLLRLPRRGL